MYLILRPTLMHPKYASSCIITNFKHEELFFTIRDQILCYPQSGSMSERRQCKYKIKLEDNSMSILFFF